MAIHESAQDYLETILVLSKKNKNVRSIDIANDMGFTKQSVSRAMKNLKENNLITIDSQGYIMLSDEGKTIADRIYDRHTTLTNYFIKIGVSLEIALKDACKIEHDLSEETFNRIKNELLKK